jgi:hypothetical protein
MPADRPSNSKTQTDAHPERSSEETRERVIRLAFGGDRERYDRFVHTLREALPPDVSVILRGSAVTGSRWEDGAPFDHDGPGTSDLDLTLIGGGMVKHFEVFYVPGLHSAPLGDAHPDASVMFLPLQRALTSIAGRPVNLQATADLVQYVRDVVMNQPYFTIIEKDHADGKHQGTSGE